MLTPAQKKRIKYLTRVLIDVTAEIHELKDLARSGPSDGTVTVYTVSETRVKSHVRSGFRAVRVRR